MNLDPSAIFSVLTIIVGGACVLLLVSTKTLRDSRDDQEKRITFLEGDRQRISEESAKKDAAIEVLRKSMTGETYLVAISDMTEHISRDLNQHHREAVDQWNTMSETLATMVETLVAVKDALERVEK